MKSASLLNTTRPSRSATVGDRRVRAAIALRKIQRMKHITAHWLQLLDEGSRQLGIQQDLHADRRSIV